MSERWRVFVWRSARREPLTPDKQAEWPHMTQYIICAMLHSFGNVSRENCKHNCVLFGIFALEISWLYSARMTGILLFVLYRAVCFLAFSHLPSLTRLHPTPPVDVFFTDDLLWISNLQCSDCYRQQRCFSRAVKAELPPALSESVTPPFHALVSL